MVAPRKAKSARSQSLRKKRPTVAVIGYGPQGRALAQNLCDSGYPVIVGLRTRSKSRSRVRKDGLSIALSIPVAVRQAHIVCFAFPDHLHGRVFKRSIAPYLRRRATLWFLHSTSVHFGFLTPPKHCDVILVAPHAPGQAVRETFLIDRNLSAFYAVYQNPSRNGVRTAARLAAAIGVKRQNLLKTTFEQEAVGDLFGEQAVLCGGLAMLIKTGFEVLVDHGWRPEHAYLEVAHQIDLIVELIRKHGIAGMFARISPAAQYGSLLAGPKIIDSSTRARMDELFERIQSGAFAAQLNALDEQSLSDLKIALKKLSDPRFEKAARRFSR